MLPRQSYHPGMSETVGESGGVGVRGFALGPFQTNCYVVWDAPDTAQRDVPARGSACWIVDASFQPEDLIQFVRAHALRPERLILTHAHVDHMAGIDEIVEALGSMPVAQHESEREWLSNAALNLSVGLGEPIVSRRKPRPDEVLIDGQELVLGTSRWRVLHTPGHSPGSVALWCGAAGLVLAGDTLFAGSIGRTDFPGSDHATLVRSIRERLYTLPEQTRVCPGHGPATTIGRERRTNPYVRA